MLELLGDFLVFHLLDEVLPSFFVLMGDSLWLFFVFTVEIGAAGKVPAFFWVGVVKCFASALHIN